MVFQLETTDGLAQKGIIKIDNETISIPNIIFPSLPDIPFPDDASLLLQNHSEHGKKQEYQIRTNTSKNNTLFTITNPVFYPHIITTYVEKNITSTYPPKNQITYVLSGIPRKDNRHLFSNVSLFIISHALQLYKNPTDLVSYIHQLRAMISPEQLVYLPSIATPQNISVLLSLGVDLIDATQAIIAARSQFLLFPEGLIKKTEMKTNPCYCPHCISKKTKPKDLTFTEILMHNYQMLREELERTIHAISTETLRELIGIRVNNSPHLTTLIRQAEKDHSHILEQRTPRHKKSLLKATQIDALQLPEIKRFQQKIITQYKKPKRANVLVILPCSAKKPYSFSKSHKKIMSAIQSVPYHHQIHELIITSPLGIVPRELELMYPASSYDIPVTGNWFEDEKKMIITLLNAYLKHNHYDTIIIHIPEPLNSLIQETIPTAVSTQCTNSATNKKALTALTSTLKQEIHPSEKITRRQKMSDTIYSLTSFQFSPSIAEQLLKDTMIKGKYPFVRILDSTQKQLGMLTDSRGMISLTIQGAKRIQSCNQFYVHTSADFTLKGSLFSPGVADADPLIRKGDEVLVYQNNVLKGVGVAQLNGLEMVQRTSGKAVDLRHIIH